MNASTRTARAGAALRCSVMLLATLGLAGSVQAQPAPARSEYFETTGGGMNITQEENPLFYSLILRVRKQPDGKLFLRATFENPSSPDDPLVSEEVLEPNANSIFLESPRFKAVKNGAEYEVVVSVYADEERETEISRHVQRIQFSIPERLAGGLGIDLIE